MQNTAVLGGGGAERGKEKEKCIMNGITRLIALYLCNGTPKSYCMVMKDQVHQNTDNHSSHFLNVVQNVEGTIDFLEAE